MVNPLLHNMDRLIHYVIADTINISCSTTITIEEMWMSEVTGSVLLLSCCRLLATKSAHPCTLPSWKN